MEHCGVTQQQKSEGIDKVVTSILESDVVVTDLDFTLAKCYALRLPLKELRFWRKDAGIWKPGFWRWGIESAGRVFRTTGENYSIEDAVNESWKDYRTQLDEDDIERARRDIAKNRDRLLYPGAEDYLQIAREHSNIVLVTRNENALVEPFGLEFDETHEKKYNKVEFLEWLVENREWEDYVFLGDREALEPVSQISLPRERIVKIYVGSRAPESIDYDVFVPNDFRPLNRLLYSDEEHCCQPYTYGNSLLKAIGSVQNTLSNLG